jgi:hypothetical protein
MGRLGLTITVIGGALLATATVDVFHTSPAYV